jgi:hypothetical protein
LFGRVAGRTILTLRFEKWRTSMMRVIEHLIETIETLLYPKRSRDRERQ